MDDLAFHLMSGVCFGSILALIALGYTLVYGIIKLINFAHGEFYMAAAYAGYGVFTLLPPGLSPWIVLPVIVLASGVAGAGIAVLTERIAYRPIRRSGRLSALLTAIGVSFLLQSLFTFVNDAQDLNYPTEPESAIGAICQTPLMGIYAIRYVFVVVTILLTALLWYIVKYTRFGRAMRAVSQDLDTAALMGVDPDAVIRKTFMLGGFLAGIAGTLIALQGAINPTMGFMVGLKAFIAAVLGGIGSIPGAVVGGFLIGVIEYLIVYGGVPSGYKDIAAFVILILVLVIRPQGILGRKEIEKV
ncbi:MAG: branched-chain amino acid ABC transporter permease [Planctomycetota bacterium]|jgi:branched-chain amino acid transport system permease protein